MKLFELLEQYEEIDEATGIGAIFLSPTAVVVGQAHGQPLQLSPQTLQKVQQIANQHGAWSEGNRGDERFTQGQINSYKGSWDDLFAQSVSGVPYPFLYTMMANVKENNTLQKIGAEPRLSIFNHLLSKQQVYSFFPNKKFSAETLQKFFEAISQGKYNFVQMAKQPATSLNIQNFISIGEKLMWPANWESYPNNAGKVAKQATDARDKWLAQQTKGAFIVGSGHLLQVSKLTNKPIVENLRAWFGKGKKGGAGGGGWDRYNTKGERIGKCGDSKPGEGKPKCLSKSRAAKLRAKGGKKAIAQAVNRKRRQDPNKNRRGPAKNVSNKYKK